MAWARLDIDLDNAKYAVPPVSLYSDLPWRFCFHATDSLPVFLARNGRAARRPAAKIHAVRRRS
jgi:hypothetical protein